MGRIVVTLSIAYISSLTVITAQTTEKAGTRVEMLKGGEFLRISVKRERERYLVYLPVMP